MRDELAGGLVAGNKVCTYEVYDAIRVGLLAVLEVEPVVHLTNVNGLLVSCMLQYHLLKVEEGSFVMDTLA